MENKLLEKERQDFELEIRGKYPNAKFIDGEIFDAQVEEEDREYYRKLCNEEV